MNNELNMLFDLAYGHITAKAIHIATDLKLHKILYDRSSISIPSLAKRLKFHPAGLKKLLKILDAHRIIFIDHNQMIKPTKITPLLEYIDSPHILLSYKTINCFKTTCQTNNETFSEAYGEKFYSYIKNRKLVNEFKVWCTKTAEIWLPSILDLYDFSNVKHIVDLGSGEGYLTSMILEKHRTLKATLIDKPEILNNAKSVLNRYSVKSRTHLYSGNFFDANTLPKNKDTYVLCRTLLNWSNADACTIINVCNEIMGSKSKLLIIDFYMPKKNHSAYKRSLLSDAALLATFNSANRTIEEWQHLIDRSNLKINKTYLGEKQFNSEPMLTLA
jgi:hypothetical protein